MSKGRDNEDHIKKKIIEYHERGVCDSRGNTVPKKYRSPHRAYFVVPEFKKGIKC